MKKTSRKTILAVGAATVLALAIASPAAAQNMQGPGAVNFGAASSPQTGGVVNTQPAGPQTKSNTGSRKLYNSMRTPRHNQTGAGGAPADNNNGGVR